MRWTYMTEGLFSLGYLPGDFAVSQISVWWYFFMWNRTRKRRHCLTYNKVTSAEAPCVSHESTNDEEEEEEEKTTPIWREKRNQKRSGGGRGGNRGTRRSLLLRLCCTCCHAQQIQYVTRCYCIDMKFPANRWNKVRLQHKGSSNNFVQFRCDKLIKFRSIKWTTYWIFYVLFKLN